MTQQRYRALAEWPPMATALVFLGAYAWQVVGRIDGAGADWLDGVMWVTWCVFVLDYAANLWLAENRRQWLGPEPARAGDRGLAVLPALAVAVPGPKGGGHR
ncbi:hypothetical protein [Arthrobacter sp. ISL-85]|uniref:hypothetical protein n=1 Tax=Arthrobacter sp. ISL-85 TaxID=2819115 RepID=UPI002034DB93|nr:hypothetical protein [Arthrobacter sp. ISL-85]